MFIVGIDVAKRNHEVTVITSAGQVVCKGFRISNTCTGYNRMMERLGKLTNLKSQFIFAMESTAHYWLALYTRLKKDGHQVIILNPIQTHTMREMFLMLAYGRSQSAFTQDGLAVGAGLEDLGADLRSQVGTSYSTLKKGPRYLELTEGYVQKLALDQEDKIIGYQFVRLGKLMDLIRQGVPADQALEQATGTYGRYDEGVRFIDPRAE